MWKTVKRAWKYLAMKLRVSHEEHADPKVQLMQAVEELKLQHRRAVQQAAKVVAAQRVAQQRLEQLTGEYQKLRVTADQALLLADQQHQLGETEQAARFEQHAEAIVVRVMELEQGVTNQGLAVLQATKAADQAKEKVTENAERLGQKLEETNRLLSDIERTKMFEALNEANRQLDQTLDDDVPTFAGVSEKVDRQLQTAIAAGDLAALTAAGSTDAPVRAVNQAVKSVQAQAWLDERRAMLGLAAAEAPVQLVPIGDDSTRAIDPPPPPPRRQTGS
jgi:phage shock protein A